MPETTPLIKAALNLRGGAGFDVYKYTKENPSSNIPNFVLNILLMAMNIVLKKNQGEIYFVGKMVLK